MIVLSYQYVHMYYSYLFYGGCENHKTNFLCLDLNLNFNLFISDLPLWAEQLSGVISDWGRDDIKHSDPSSVSKKQETIDQVIQSASVLVVLGRGN